MSSQNKKDITIVLATYLPQISITMNNVIRSLQIFIEGESSVSDPAIYGLVDKELPSIVDSIRAASDEIDPVSINSGNREAVRLCLETFREILKGIQQIIDWIKDEKHPEEYLKDAIDTLFSGGQNLLSVVSSITDKSE